MAILGIVKIFLQGIGIHADHPWLRKSVWEAIL